MIDAEYGLILPIKIKLIAAFGCHKRRDMKNIFADKLLPFCYRTLICMCKQIDMPLAKGIAHFTQNGTHFALRIVAKPKTYRIKYIAQYAR